MANGRAFLGLFFTCRSQLTFTFLFFESTLSPYNFDIDTRVHSHYGPQEYPADGPSHRSPRCTISTTRDRSQGSITTTTDCTASFATNATSCKYSIGQHGFTIRQLVIFSFFLGCFLSFIILNSSLQFGTSTMSFSADKKTFSSRDHVCGRRLRSGIPWQ